VRVGFTSTYVKTLITFVLITLNIGLSYILFREGYINFPTSLMYPTVFAIALAGLLLLLDEKGERIETLRLEEVKEEIGIERLPPFMGVNHSSSVESENLLMSIYPSPSQLEKEALI